MKRRNNMPKGSFIMHNHYLKKIELLNMEERGELFSAILKYANYGEEPTFSSAVVAMAFAFIAQQMNFDKAAYEERCRKNSENISKRWQNHVKISKPVTVSANECNANIGESIPNDTTVYEGLPRDTTVYLYDNDYENENENDNDNENDNENDFLNERERAARKFAFSPEKDVENSNKTPVMTRTPKKAENAESVCGNKKEALQDTVSHSETDSTSRKIGDTKKKKKSSDNFSMSLHGRYKNVRLTAFDEASLKIEFPNDFEERIERLSEYIATHGDKYRNHAAVIRAWAKNGRDTLFPVCNAIASAPAHPDSDLESSTNEYFEAALARSRRYLEEMRLEGELSDKTVGESANDVSS